MGITYVTARLRRPDGRGPSRTVRFLVDSGAIYSVLPEKIWRALRLKPERQVEFMLADGTPIKRAVSECRFEIRGEGATSPVVLGEEDDGALLGAVTLETLGLMLNPLTREILPMRMALSYLRGFREVPSDDRVRDHDHSRLIFLPSSNSSKLRGQSSLSSLDKLLSANSFPPVWHVAQ
jgi:clan AA aspartic protease